VAGRSKNTDDLSSIRKKNVYHIFWYRDGGGRSNNVSNLKNRMRFLSLGARQCSGGPR
jgi:hypothetical protein